MLWNNSQLILASNVAYINIFFVIVSAAIEFGVFRIVEIREEIIFQMCHVHSSFLAAFAHRAAFVLRPESISIYALYGKPMLNSVRNGIRCFYSLHELEQFTIYNTFQICFQRFACNVPFHTSTEQRNSLYWLFAHFESVAIIFSFAHILSPSITHCTLNALWIFWSLM